MSKRQIYKKKAIKKYKVNVTGVLVQLCNIFVTKVLEKCNKKSRRKYCNFLGNNI